MSRPDDLDTMMDDTEEKKGTWVGAICFPQPISSDEIFPVLHKHALQALEHEVNFCSTLV